VYDLELSFGERTAKNQSRISELLIESLGEFDIRVQLSQIKCPVLVVHGESDPLPKEAPTSVHRNLAQSEFLVLENTGHFMFIEALDELIGAIRIFFENKFPD
jgi:proline iminopeptidase